MSKNCFCQLFISHLRENKINQLHPGEILQTEFLNPRQITQTELAQRMNISVRRVNAICRGKRGITYDTAFRLALVFNLGTGGVEF